MRTTVSLDDAIVAHAREATGITETSALLRHALTLVIQVEASRRLARLGGTQPDLEDVPRRRLRPEPA